MYQIAIGDSSAGFTVLDGASIAAPNFKATVNFDFSSLSFIQENIEIELKGTIAQINAFLSTLELIIQRAALYSVGKYFAPQQLRFQRLTGDPYYYTPISNIYLAANPAGYLHHAQGSKLVILHYTRPNHFDGPKTELILSGRNGTGITGGYTIYNHTDSGVGHGSSVFVAKTNFSTQLPARVSEKLCKWVILKD